MNLDFTSFEKAILQLDEGLRMAAGTPDNKLMRDGVIQRFEYTYELSHKMLKRFLEATEASPEQFDEMSFADLIRTASERGLVLHGWDKWSQYRKLRGTTSHTYDAKKAAEVFEAIPGFLEDARHLLQKMRSRQEGDR